MTRLKSISFTGSTPRDVSKTTPIYKRWLERAIGETSHIYDQLTGSNGETETINHIGSNGRGAILRMPLANQLINASIGLAAGSGEDYYHVVAVPVYIPRGEALSYWLEVDMTPPATHPNCSKNVPRHKAVIAYVRGNAGALNYGPIELQATEQLVQPPFRDPNSELEYTWPELGDIGSVTFRGLISGLAEGLNYIFVSRRCFLAPAGSQYLTGFRIYPSVSYNSGAGVSLSNANAGNPYPVPTAFTTSTFKSFDSTQVEDNGPLDSFILTHLNRNMNLLYEYLTGGKVEGNNTRQCAITRNHDAVVFTNEPNIDIPVACYAFGGCIDDYPAGLKNASNIAANTNPTTGIVDWLRAPKNHAALASMSLSGFVMPLRNNSAGNLQCTILVQQQNGSALNWGFYAETSGGGGSSSTFNCVRIGTTNYYQCTIDDLPYDSGVHNSVQIYAQHSAPNAAVLTDIINVLGVCFYFVGN
jgi:hypothetical protein